MGSLLIAGFGTAAQKDPVASGYASRMALLILQASVAVCHYSPYPPGPQILFLPFLGEAI